MATAIKSDVEIPAEAIHLTPLIEARIELQIIGLSPLIPHRWSEKAKRMMLDKQQGKAVPQRAPKDPAQEANDATYWMQDGRPGIPATAFKAATADAARYFDKRVSIELLKRAVFVYGEGDEQLVEIDGEISMREDQPRNSGGTADLRYRNQFWPWQATLTVGYLEAVLTPEAVVAVVDAGGRGGVGDWRPSAPKSKTGTFGRYRVEGLS
jgi:hypothetical protein